MRFASTAGCDLLSEELQPRPARARNACEVRHDAGNLAGSNTDTARAAVLHHEIEV
jgi:hypothetical protein